MRGRIKKGIALVLSAVLSVATCVTTIPGLSATVYAAETGKNIRLGASALSDNANTSSAATVHYGSSSDTWRVIGYGGTGVASSSGTLTLIASGIMEHGAFDSSTPYSNNYSGSNLQSMIGTLAGRLSTEEAAVVATRTLVGGIANYGETDYDDNKISGSDVSDAVMWPLSVAEANLMNSDLRKADPANPSLASSVWWLRSPGGYLGRSAAGVNGFGFVLDDGELVNVDDYGVRPAFNLNLQSIIFTSAAAGGKASGSLGAGALATVADYSGTEWKLTLLDDGSTNAAGNGHAGFSASRVDSGNVVAGNNVYVSYSGAKTGSNEYVSAMIVSTANENMPLYYGRIANNSASNTGMDITIPSGLSVGDYKIKLFSEQYNGDQMTDLVSSFVSIPVTVTAASSSTTVVVNADAGGSITHKSHNTANQNDTVSIVAAPDTGYTFERWECIAGDITFANVTSANTSFTVDGTDNISVRAVFAAIPSTPNIPNPTPQGGEVGDVDYFADLKNAFDYAIALGGNQTVTWNTDCVLTYDIMKLLAEHTSITLAFSYTYEDVDYKVTIPGRLAKPDPTIPIYGPLYLYGTYGGTAKKH